KPSGSSPNFYFFSRSVVIILADFLCKHNLNNMKGRLTQNQIHYVFYHLNLFLDLNGEIKERILFVNNSSDLQNIKSRGKIIFMLSENSLDHSKAIAIDNILYLFSNSKIKEHYRIENDNLIFNHDILKSAFYLLSGYQEQFPKQKDMHDRFRFAESVQYKLGFVDKPLVNYYFQIIIEGLKEFGKLNKIFITEKNYFKTFGFILSHDIDRVDYYSIHQIKYFIKGLLGLSQTGYSKKQLFFLLPHNIVGCIFPFLKKDRYWSFEWLRKTETKLGIKSTFYFLLKGIKHHDAYYDVNEKRIRKIINYLENEGCEIGVHGTVGSYKDAGELKYCIKRLNKVTSEKIKGIRQHRLKFNHPETFKIQQNEGLIYDSTLGFAEHEGFRNSFCFPFKPYDFEKDRMIDIWEIPLMVMDVTLFNYRNLSFAEAQIKIENLIGEVNKFSGIFTLLWHNGYFDEIKFPGITDFYTGLLKRIMKKNPKADTGIGTINQIINKNSTNAYETESYKSE
ncbi:MAG: polysaccharide deacetylase family protein, partial [bacterium]